MARPAPTTITSLASLVGGLGLIVLGGLGLGCRVERAPEPSIEPAPLLDSDRQDVEPREVELADSAPPPPPYKPASVLGAPVEIRRAKRGREALAEPHDDAASRGRIIRGQTFYVYERREGPGCDRAWGLVGDSAWVCLERTEASELTPVELPELADDALLPWIYARHEDHDDPSTPALPLYRSLSDYRSGAAPVDTRPAYGSYAFTKRRANHGDPVLVTVDRKIVPAAELEEFEPSEFRGRELVEAPVPDGQTLAWAVRWKTVVRVAPDPEAKSRRRVKYHHTLGVVGEPVIGSEGEPWFEVARPGGDAGGGFVPADDIRRFVPVPPPEPVLGGQITIDVDLDQQVLSVWIERTPVFTTLISSGRLNDRTPLGLYRIETKRAWGKMANLPSAQEPYYVEAVPWTMYFMGRYALHAAFWHDMFGHRHSHGCVNLSPHDAKRVFELASPRLPDGWLLVHEHESDPGALVRIRRGDEPVPDRRAPLTAEP